MLFCLANEMVLKIRTNDEVGNIIVDIERWVRSARQQQQQHQQQYACCFI